MESEPLYIVLADGWYVSRKGTEFVASPDKVDAESMNLKSANNLFRQLQLMGHVASVEFAVTPHD